MQHLTRTPFQYLHPLLSISIHFITDSVSLLLHYSKLASAPPSVNSLLGRHTRISHRSRSKWGYKTRSIPITITSCLCWCHSFVTCWWHTGAGPCTCITSQGWPRIIVISVQLKHAKKMRDKQFRAKPRTKKYVKTVWRKISDDGV